MTDIIKNDAQKKEAMKSFEQLYDAWQSGDEQLLEAWRLCDDDGKKKIIELITYAASKKMDSQN